MDSLIINGIVNKEDQRVKLFWLLWKGWCSTPVYSNKNKWSQTSWMSMILFSGFANLVAVMQSRRVISNISPLNGQRSMRLPTFSDLDKNSASAVTPDFALPLPVSFHHPCLSSIIAVSHNLASTPIHPSPICSTCLHPKYSLPSKE